jgi:hypothetical protein
MFIAGFNNMYSINQFINDHKLFYLFYMYIIAAINLHILVFIFIVRLKKSFKIFFKFI